MFKKNDNVEIENIDESRIARKKRKKKNRFLAYLALVLILVIFVGVGVMATTQISSYLEQRQTQEQEKLDESEQIAEALAAVEVAEEEVEEEVEEEEPLVTEEDLLEEMIALCIQDMSLEDKVAGLFFVTPEAITGVSTAVQAGEGTATALEEYPVGGLIYFSQNIQSQSQITEMLANTTAASKYPIFLGVDEEGGDVARVADSLDLNNVGDMADIGDTDDAKNAYLAMEEVATYLLEYGFNVNFAPVADVLTDETNTSIGDRSFSSDVGVVTEMIPSAVTGLEDYGISACLKHFPGIGDADGDTHDGRVTVTKTLDELRELEFLPFQAGIEAGVDMIMVGHILLPEVIEDNVPCSLSEEIITDVLRVELGYEGIIITDALNMSAITEYYGSDEAAIMALKAGADMILMPEDF